MLFFLFWFINQNGVSLTFVFFLCLAMTCTSITIQGQRWSFSLLLFWKHSHDFEFSLMDELSVRIIFFKVGVSWGPVDGVWRMKQHSINNTSWEYFHIWMAFLGDCL